MPESNLTIALRHARLVELASRLTPPNRVSRAGKALYPHTSGNRALKIKPAPLIELEGYPCLVKGAISGYWLGCNSVEDTEPVEWLAWRQRDARGYWRAAGVTTRHVYRVKRAPGVGGYNLLGLSQWQSTNPEDLAEALARDHTVYEWLTHL